MNIVKKIVCIMCIVVVLFLFSSCKKDDLTTVGESPVPMHSVTQNSKDNYITFKFDIPKNWKSYEKDSFVLQAFDTKYLEM